MNVFHSFKKFVINLSVFQVISAWFSFAGRRLRHVLWYACSPSKISEVIPTTMEKAVQGEKNAKNYHHPFRTEIEDGKFQNEKESTIDRLSTKDEHRANSARHLHHSLFYYLLSARERRLYLEYFYIWNISLITYVNTVRISLAHDWLRQFSLPDSSTRLTNYLWKTASCFPEQRSRY